MPTRTRPMATIAVLVVIGSAVPARANDRERSPSEGPNAPVAVTGKIDEVTVYRGQAMVTRVIEVGGVAGLREIVVTDLPERIQPNSLYAESTEGVVIGAVRYRVRPVMEDVREEVRAIDQEIRDLDRKLQANERKSRLLSAQADYLARLEDFTAPTASVELSKGVLNADTLKELTQFIFEQRRTAAEEGLRLSAEREDLDDARGLLQRKRDQVAGKSSRDVREAVVFADVPAGGGRFRLRYLVENAGWSPYYNARANQGGDTVHVEYYASVFQRSAEDWSDVRMTLSTATPNLVSKAPVLDPLSLTLVPSGQAPFQLGEAVALQKSQLRQQLLDVGRSRRRGGQQQQEANESILGAVGPMPDNSFDGVLNKMACDLQVLDLAAVGGLRGPMDSPTRDEGVSISYAVPARTSLPSRSDRQLIQIGQLTLPGEFYKVATPVLTEYVYDEARVTNTSDMMLLAGPLATYVDGEFVGSGQLPMVAVGERFTVGLGIDPSLRTHRDLIHKRDTVQGGNRVVDVTYGLTIENFGTDAAHVRLLDRLPKAKDGQLRVELLSDESDLSSNSEYLRTLRKDGILRWDVSVPGKSVGPDAFSIEYQFRLEYDKQMAVAGATT